MTMFIITDGNNNVSRVKPVEYGRRLGQNTRRVSLEFGSERACAPPALSALNLGRLLRVVRGALPVKRDRSADNPNSACDYSSCAPEE